MHEYAPRAGQPQGGCGSTRQSEVLNHVFAPDECQLLRDNPALTNESGHSGWAAAHEPGLSNERTPASGCQLTQHE